MGKDGKRQGILVGAVPLGEESQLLKKLLEAENVYSVAVDGGIGFFVKNGVKPDCFLGDMDSAAEYESAACDLGLPTECICEAPVRKDDTDMALAVKKAWEAGCEEILIFGGMGGERISHTLANIQLMHSYAKKDCHIVMVSKNWRMEVLCKGVKAFSRNMKGLLSVFSLTDAAKCVKIEGLQYGFRGNLRNDCALGVSNAFIGKEGRISIEGEGCLLLVYENEETGETTDEWQRG